MLPVIISIISGLLLLTLLVLAIPVTVTFSVQHGATLTNEVIVAWFFGWLRYAPTKADLTRGQKLTKKSQKKPGAKKQTEKVTETPKRRPSDLVKTMLKTEGFVKRIIHFLQKLIGGVHLRTLHFKGRIGLHDPYDTGRLWGLASALTGIIHMKPRVLLQIEPDFNQATFEIDGHGIIRIIPIQMIGITTLFLLSPPTLRAAWAAIKWRRQA